MLMGLAGYNVQILTAALWVEGDLFSLTNRANQRPPHAPPGRQICPLKATGE